MESGDFRGTFTAWTPVFQCEEVLALICSYLLPFEVATGKCVCQQWNQYLNNSLSFNRAVISDFPVKDRNGLHFARNRGNPRFMEFLHSVCVHGCFLQHIELVLGGKETCCLNKVLSSCRLKNLKSFKLRFVYDQFYLINYGSSFTPTPRTRQEKTILRYFRQYPRLSPRSVLDKLCTVLSECLQLEVLHLGRECPLSEESNSAVTSVPTSNSTTSYSVLPYTYELTALQHLPHLRELRIDGWDSNGSILKAIPHFRSLRVFVWTSKGFDTEIWTRELCREDKVISSDTLQLIDLRGLEDGHFITTIGHCPQLKQLMLRKDCGLLRGGSSMIFSSFMMQHQHLKKFIRTDVHSKGTESRYSGHSSATSTTSLDGSLASKVNSSTYKYFYLSPPYNAPDIQTPIITNSASGQVWVGGMFEGLYPVADKMAEDSLYGVRYCKLPVGEGTTDYVMAFVPLELPSVGPQVRIRQFMNS